MASFLSLLAAFWSFNFQTPRFNCYVHASKSSCSLLSSWGALCRKPWITVGIIGILSGLAIVPPEQFCFRVHFGFCVFSIPSSAYRHQFCFISSIRHVKRDYRLIFLRCQLGVLHSHVLHCPARSLIAKLFVMRFLNLMTHSDSFYVIITVRLILRALQRSLFAD